MTTRDQLRHLLAFLADVVRCGLMGRRMISAREKKIAELEKALRAQATLLAAKKGDYTAGV